MAVLDELFSELPDDAKIEETSARVVGILLSTNVANAKIGALPRAARAYLINVFTLRGTYKMYAYFEYVDKTGGALFGGRLAEVTVGKYADLERAAVRWMAERSFDIKQVDLMSMDVGQRAQLMAPIPFAPADEIDIEAAVGLTVFEMHDDAMERVLGDSSPVDAVKQLRAFMIST